MCVGEVIRPEVIVRQRERGWRDFHPEAFCHRCGRRNIESWYADPGPWAEATKHMPRGVLEILCPQCFTKAWERNANSGQFVTWRVSVDPSSLASVEGEEEGNRVLREALSSALDYLEMAVPFFEHDCPLGSGDNVPTYHTCPRCGIEGVIAGEVAPALASVEEENDG